MTTQIHHTSEQLSYQPFLVCAVRQGFSLEIAQKLHSTQLNLWYYILNRLKTFFRHHHCVWALYSCMQHNHHLCSLVDSKNNLPKFGSLYWRQIVFSLRQQATILSYCDDFWINRAFKQYFFICWNHVTIAIHKSGYIVHVLSKCVELHLTPYCYIY